ncbi:hypothetical protein DFQ27_002814 [Actinomortierella ambigua]|uniref:BTB domain-containing protein n=1 Tax=Actinomortierella ambigua TaxID=1343610 RepID=A0A9P6U6I2_9FUNG|nr:hypothetical protein DFQ27_002814 [Actinomortierella ambigua]
MLPRTQSLPSIGPQSVLCRECIAITNERLKMVLQQMPEPKRPPRFPETPAANRESLGPKRRPRELKFATVTGELLDALVSYLYFGHLPEFGPSVGFDLCAMYACARYLELTDLEQYCLAELVGVDTQRGGPLLARNIASVITTRKDDDLYNTLDYRSSLADPEYLIQELFSWAASYSGPCRAICRTLAMHHKIECSPESELMTPHQYHPMYCTVLTFLAQERVRMILR